MHLSLAAGTPVVALFGPTVPKVLIKNDPRFHPIVNGRDCQGCWNGSMDMIEPGVCPKDIPVCMETIDMDEVLGEITSLAPVERS